MRRLPLDRGPAVITHGPQSGRSGAVSGTGIRHYITDEEDMMSPSRTLRPILALIVVGHVALVPVGAQSRARWVSSIC